MIQSNSNITFRTIFLTFVFVVGSISSCYKSEDLNVPVNETDDAIQNQLDEYIDENFVQEYGMAIRYRFVDRYVDPNQRVTPPRLEVVRPMLDFIDEYWIEPYLAVENGEQFFRDHVPAENVLLGGLIYNEDGTVILGQADAGAQITFTNVNAVDMNNTSWVIQQLQTVYHEFAHIVHQRYKLPNAFEEITPQGYTSAGSWFTLTDGEAIERGFVSPYATSSPNEDYAETVAFYLFDKDFFDNFINEEDCTSADCVAQNEGKKSINVKLNSILAHYFRETGVQLEDVRDAVQAKL